MSLLTILCLVASTFALPALELSIPPDALTASAVETALLMIIPNDEKSEVAEQKAKTSEISLNDQSNDKEQENKERIIEEEKIMLFLSVLPSSPELPPLDESIFASLLKIEKLKDSQDDTDTLRSLVMKWKLPKIRFPGRYIIDDV